jgi:predicted nucleic acid-binding protein
MPDYLLDSGILIRHLRNRPGYLALLQRLGQDGDLHIASFSRVEIVRGTRDHERASTFLLLDSLITDALDSETADRAGQLIRTWQAQGVVLSGPDALIAATALRTGATLVTTNARHFPMPDLIVIAADEDGHVTSYIR